MLFFDPIALLTISYPLLHILSRPPWAKDHHNQFGATSTTSIIISCLHFREHIVVENTTSYKHFLSNWILQNWIQQSSIRHLFFTIPKTHLTSFWIFSILNGNNPLLNSPVHVCKDKSILARAYTPHHKWSTLHSLIVLHKNYRNKSLLHFDTIHFWWDPPFHLYKQSADFYVSQNELMIPQEFDDQNQRQLQMKQM